jgi:CII-binding regulator of phage lambda lysogenization HflD
MGICRAYLFNIELVKKLNMAQKANKPEIPKVEPQKVERAEKVTIRDILNELLERTSSNMKRLRLLEQKIDSLTSRVNTIENGILEQRRDLTNSISDLNKKLSEDDDRLVKLETGLKEIVAQLKNVATMAKIRELEQLIEIYNPIKSQFVTREEIERLLEERK